MNADLSPEEWERLAWEQEVVCECGHPYLVHSQVTPPVLACTDCVCPMYFPDESKVRLDFLSPPAVD